MKSMEGGGWRLRRRRASLSRIKKSQSEMAVLSLSLQRIKYLCMKYAELDTMLWMDGSTELDISWAEE